MTSSRREPPELRVVSTKKPEPLALPDVDALAAQVAKYDANIAELEAGKKGLEDRCVEWESLLGRNDHEYNHLMLKQELEAMKVNIAQIQDVINQDMQGRALRQKELDEARVILRYHGVSDDGSPR